jgi:hypothetical protein
MNAIDKGKTLSASTGIACGIAMMTIGFIFPHVPRVLAALLFDTGCLVAVFCLILLLVE